MKKNNLKSAIFKGFGLIALTVFSACDKNDDTGKPHHPVNPTHSVLVLNEGNYGDANASVSLFSKETRTVQHNLFSKANNRPLGDVLQSAFVLHETGYLVVNNSNKVEVVNINTFQATGVIANLKQPRYFTAASHFTGYISEWVTSGSNGQVSVVDLHTNTVTNTIPVGKQPEQMLLHDNKLYVANYGETFVSVIDVASEAVVNTIEVGDGPKELTMDVSGNIWVLCGGKFAPDWLSTTPGSLVKFSPAAPAARTVLPFTSTSGQPEDLVINAAKDRLYYSYEGAVYQLPVQASAISATPLIQRNFYGLGIDPADNTIYGASAPSFASSGSVIRYNTAGMAIDSFQAGVGPNGFIFR